VFGIYSGFSGQKFYETVLDNIYNLVFTSWSIIFYATADLEYTKNILVNNP
jgi:hypothetical protein